MNLKMIAYSLGKILQIEAALLAVPLCVGLIYHEGQTIYLAYLGASCLAFLVGSLLKAKKPKDTNIYTKDGLVIVALVWLVYSIIGCLPLIITGEVPKFVDAFFEIISGFTTTGASIIPNVEALSQASLFWRSFTHLIGGMGVILFALAVLPGLGAETIHIMKAEATGPSFGKVSHTIQDTARRLYLIYLSMTAILTLVLMLCGMNLFDALIHAFSAAGTGGFSNYKNSVAHFNSPLIEVVLGFGVLAFGVNFNVYHYLLLSKFRSRPRSEEFNWYISIAGLSTLLISLNILPQILAQGGNYWESLRHSFFYTASIMTTTGFVTVDYNLWPVFSRTMLLAVMCIGGCAGSTAGGLKVSRVAMVTKSAILGIRGSQEPRRALPLRFEYKAVRPEKLRKVFQFLVIYILFFALCMFIVSLDQVTFEEAFSSVAASINCIGPGMGRMGPTGNYAMLTPLSKYTLCFAMIAGRLEFYPILMLLGAPFSKKRAV